MRRSGRHRTLVDSWAYGATRPQRGGNSLHGRGLQGRLSCSYRGASASMQAVPSLTVGSSSTLHLLVKISWPNVGRLVDTLRQGTCLGDYAPRGAVIEEGPKCR